MKYVINTLKMHLKSAYYRLFRICHCGNEKQYESYEMAMHATGGYVPFGSQLFVYPVGLNCLREAAALEDKLSEEEKEALDYESDFGDLFETATEHDRRGENT